jgi:hypothetical protein
VPFPSFRPPRQMADAFRFMGFTLLLDEGVATGWRVDEVN